MEFTFTNQTGQPIGIKKFLNQNGISHRMYSEIKNGNGQLIFDDQDGQVGAEQSVKLILADEPDDSNVLVSHEPIQVVYEDQNWLVIDKPAGLTTVPGPANRSDTLVNRIKGYLIDQKANNLVPHIITRLDRFTSGLVLVAKHHLANSLANTMLADQQITKEYLAILSGIGLNAHAEIDKPIEKVPDQYYLTVGPNGKPANTEYWLVKEFSEYSLVKIKLHTGRTHQIRVHFTDMDHPLLGDELYQGPLDLGIDRQALHAYLLEFIDPFTKEKLHFESSLPNDMQKLLDK